MGICPQKVLLQQVAKFSFLWASGAKKLIQLIKIKSNKLVATI